MSENLPHRTPSPNPMQSADWEGGLADELRPSFPHARYQTYLGQSFVELNVSDVVPMITQLRDRWQFEMLTDLTAVHRPGTPEPFEIVYILYSFSRNEHLRLKTHVASNAPSVTQLFEAANWLEREVFDMFGVVFDGHPNLKRILLPEDWSGHPLVKEASIIDMDNDWVQRNLGIESGQS